MMNVLKLIFTKVEIGYETNLIPVVEAAAARHIYSVKVAYINPRHQQGLILPGNIRAVLKIEETHSQPVGRRGYPLHPVLFLSIFGLPEHLSHCFPEKTYSQ